MITDGRAIANSAEAFVVLFTEFGLPPTFINDLTAGADSLEQAMQLQNEAVAARVLANANCYRIRSAGVKKR